MKFGVILYLTKEFKKANTIKVHLIAAQTLILDPFHRLLICIEKFLVFMRSMSSTLLS